jgi:predicted enzyme related to lactoylglutathione lyase
MSFAGIDRIKAVTIAVADQEAALAWYTEKLGFEKKADLGVPGFRWLTVAPAGQEDTEFLLASWFPDHIGKNATCVLHTKDCAAAYETLSGRGVEFAQPPQSKPYGTEAVFKDLHGNRYALVQPHLVDGARS